MTEQIELIRAALESAVRMKLAGANDAMDALVEIDTRLLELEEELALERGEVAHG